MNINSLTPKIKTMKRENKPEQSIVSIGGCIILLMLIITLAFVRCNDRGNKENTDRFYKQDTVKVDSVLVDSTQRPGK